MSMLTGEDNGEMRLYEDLGDFSAIKPMFEEILALYNSKRKAMMLVFFEDALEHLTRICRTMRCALAPLPLVVAHRQLAHVQPCGLLRRQQPSLPHPLAFGLTLGRAGCLKATCSWSASAAAGSRA